MLLPTPGRNIKPSYHEMEEATYNSEALAAEDVVAWVASEDPAPEVIHIDVRSPSRNSYLGGKAWSTRLWRPLRFRVPSLRFLHFLPLTATMHQLCVLTQGGRPRTPTSRATPPLTWCIPPPPPPPLRHGLQSGSGCRFTT